VQVDFSRPIGGICVCVADGDSASGVLWILHSVHNFPGTPGVSRDQMTSFCSEADVDGVGISTVAFNENQLAVTLDSIVPGTIERMLQLLADDPSKKLRGPFEVSDVNVWMTKARSAAYIPFGFMKILIWADVASRQAYELMVPALVADGLAYICEPLVDFLTVA
jgi:hypothetical protein